MDNEADSARSLTILLIFRNDGKVKPILKEFVWKGDSTCKSFLVLIDAILSVYFTNLLCKCRFTTGLC